MGRSKLAMAVGKVGSICPRAPDSGVPQFVGWSTDKYVQLLGPYSEHHYCKPNEYLFVHSILLHTCRQRDGTPP